MIPAMIASVEVMLKRWRQHDGKEIDVFQEFKLLTSEIISRTAFGSSYLEGQHVFDMLTRMGDIIVRNHYKITIPGIRYVSYISPTSSIYLCLTNLVFIYFVNLWWPKIEVINSLPWAKRPMG